MMTETHASRMAEYAAVFSNLLCDQQSVQVVRVICMRCMVISCYNGQCAKCSMRITAAF